jgi:hypothetical protein
MSYLISSTPGYLFASTSDYIIGQSSSTPPDGEVKSFATNCVVAATGIHNAVTAINVESEVTSNLQSTAKVLVSLSSKAPTESTISSNSLSTVGTTCYVASVSVVDIATKGIVQTVSTVKEFITSCNIATVLSELYKTVEQVSSISLKTAISRLYLSSSKIDISGTLGAVLTEAYDSIRTLVTILTTKLDNSVTSSTVITEAAESNSASLVAVITNSNNIIATASDVVSNFIAIPDLEDMDMVIPAVVNLYIRKGADFSFTFDIMIDETVLDLAGATILAQLRRSASRTAPLLVAFSASANPISQEITLSLTEEQTELLPAGNAAYDVLITQGGVDTYYLEGDVKISDSVTVVPV